MEQGGSAYPQFFGVIWSFHHRSYVKPWYYNDFFKNAYVSCLLQFDFKLRSDKFSELTLLEVWTGDVDKVQFWCSWPYGPTNVSWLILYGEKIFFTKVKSLCYGMELISEPIYDVF